MSNILIAIVNYRTAELTIDCLRALSNQVSDLKTLRVMVVDNDSCDGSDIKLAAAIERECWSSWASVRQLGRNGGFAYGNNAIIRTALAGPEHFDYIMLLNPDTVVRAGAIHALVNFMDTHPDVGIGGSKLQNAQGGEECSSHTFPSPLSELDGGVRLGMLSRMLHRYVVSPPTLAHAHPCDWVSGASMIIRRQVIEDIGLMDEHFFLYFEEVDYCRRASKANWQCWYVPDSLVIHLEGASTDIRSTARRRAAYWYNSRRRFFIKHYGISGLLAADTLWFVGRLSYLLRKILRLGVKSNQDHDPKWFMFDLLWGDLRAILTRDAWFIQQSGKQA